MAGINTEKPTGIVQQKKVATQKKEPKQKLEKPLNKKEDVKVETEKKEIKEETSKEKNDKKIISKTKKDFATVQAKSLPISTKIAASVCNFIRYKPIKAVISDLEEVVKLKKSVPMKGEIPHRKGKIMSGRFPKKAAEHFLIIVKSLQANANNFDIDEPIISKAMANMASRPFARGGRARRKATHVTLVATKKELIKKRKKKE